jgi:hypothetical protein
MREHWCELEALPPGELRALAPPSKTRIPARRRRSGSTWPAAEARASFELRAELLAAADSLTAEQVDTPLRREILAEPALDHANCRQPEEAAADSET